MVKYVSHLYAPLSDHKKIILKLASNQETFGMRGYWKFNNSLLKDVSFDNADKKLVNVIIIIGRNGSSSNIKSGTLLSKEVKN